MTLFQSYHHRSLLYNRESLYNKKKMKTFSLSLWEYSSNLLLIGKHDVIKQKRQVVTTRDINNIIRDEQQWALYYYVMAHYMRMGFIYFFPLSLSLKKMSIISWNKVCNKLWLAVVKPSKPVREMTDNIWKKPLFLFFQILTPLTLCLFVKHTINRHFLQPLS